MLYSGRSISCADKTNAQALRSVGYPAKSLLLNGRLETSCFQPDSAACFSRSFVSARLNPLPFVKQNPWAASWGFACRTLKDLQGNSYDDLSSFFRLYRRRLRRQGRRLHNNHRFQSSLNSLSRHDKLTVNRRGIDDAFPNGNLEQPFHRQGIQPQLKSVALG